MDYALGAWSTLGIYLDDGRVEIDNNLVNAAHGINQVMPRPRLCRAATSDRLFLRRFQGF